MPDCVSLMSILSGYYFEEEKSNVFIKNFFFKQHFTYCTLVLQEAA